MAADFSFLLKRPYGLLMLCGAIFPIIIIICLASTPFSYEGSSIIYSVAITLLLLFLCFNAAHVMSMQLLQAQGENTFCLMPFALIIFFTSLVGGVICTLCSLLAAVAFADALRFAFGYYFTCMLVLIFLVLLTLDLLYLATLLYKSAPNSQIKRLKYVSIMGDKTTRIVMPDGRDVANLSA